MGQRTMKDAQTEALEIADNTLIRAFVELGDEPATSGLRKMWSHSCDQGKRHLQADLRSGCGAGEVRCRETLTVRP